MDVRGRPDDEWDGGTFAQPPQFDICLCDLEFADFARFSEIYAASLRFMRHGGTIIGFYLNADGAPLPIHQNEIGKDLQHIPPARVYYAGSLRSAKLLRAFRSTLSIPRRLNVVFLAKIATRLGSLAPQISDQQFRRGPRFEEATLDPWGGCHEHHHAHQIARVSLGQWNR